MTGCNIRFFGAYVCHYNFVRIHGSLRMTPAMAAGISDHLWSTEEMLNAAVTP
jgi:hypothetical protein